MTPERQDQLDEVMMRWAEELSAMSYATRSKVGAILVKDGNPISMGWNGMPSGFPHNQVEIDGVTNPLVIHAEANAIVKCSKLDGASSKGSTLFVTMSPCMECCKLILQAGIKKVFYRTEYRITEPIEVLRSAGIEVVHLKKKE